MVEKTWVIERESHTCIEFSNEILKIIGLGEVRITDIIKLGEMNRFTLTKISAYTRSLDNKEVRAFTKEEVAKEYGVSIDRVVTCPITPHDMETMPRFRILPYDRYIELKHN